MTAATDILIGVDALQRILVRLFVATGMSNPDAAFCAAALVQSDLWGIESHGVLRAPIYLKRLRSRAVNPTPTIRVTTGAGALEVLDGDAGMGFVVARAAMQRAIALARQFNVSAVGVTNSNHFGAAGLYARMAAEEGMVGIVVTNVGPNLVASGGSRPITGNNPLAISIPTFAAFPFTLDISLSNVAGGKLLVAIEKGQKIPFDWGTDKEGRPTDDPERAFAGFLLPLGGHKGLGLSYAIDILSGLITGGAFQFGVTSMYKRTSEPSRTGHFMIVINPLALMSREDLKERMAAFCETVKSSPMWDDRQEMLLPGEIEFRTEQARRAAGLRLPSHLCGELADLAREMDVPIEFPGPQ
jgi:LDH2 family malate/lactate/ureidoglycolate dehydrogenase